MAISSDPTTPKSFTIPLLGEGQDSLDDLGGHDIDHPSSIRATLDHPNTHCSSLLAPIRRCLHASYVWWPGFCSLRSWLTDRAQSSESMALKKKAIQDVQKM
ncbi:hypothetical protein NC651_012080 [Populus alba x Populus x berolinensis]|nr:hypothetical protein NC651_012080 [Populus alba x Populus x berolinensis]